MTAKLCVTFGVLVYALLIPWLEINASHVFNPGWPPHARLHEVWQLSSNMMIGAVALWLAWRRGEVRLAGVLNIAVMGGVLVAHVLAPGYGGSILSGNLSGNVVSGNVVSGNAHATVLGLPLAVFVASVVVMLAGVVVLTARKAHN